MNVFICSSPVQIIRAIHMKQQMEEFREDADLFVCAFFANSADIAQRIRELGLFRRVVLADEREKDCRLYQLLFGNNRLAREIRKQRYDTIVGFNVEHTLTQAIYNLNKRTAKLQCVEDAPNLYSIHVPRDYPWWHPYRVLGVKKHCFAVSAWWTSCPELIHVPACFTENVRKLPVVVKTPEFVNAVNYVFQYQPDETLEQADVLIMEESLFTDGDMIDNADFQLFDRIRRRYPDKSIAVKLHPRTKENRFQGKFAVLSASSVPWEVYVMNRASDNPLLQISIVCSTMVSDKLMFDDEGSKIILAPLFYDKVRAINGYSRVTAAETQRYEKVKSLYRSPENLFIAYSEEALFRTLDQLLS